MRLLDISKYLLVTIVSEWFELKDLVALDTALDTESRGILLQLVIEFRKRFSTLLHDTTISNGKAYNWLHHRKVSGWKVVLSSQNDLQDVSSYGHCLRQLHVSSDIIESMKYDLHSLVNLEYLHFNTDELVVLSDTIANFIVVHKTRLTIIGNCEFFHRACFLLSLHARRAERAILDSALLARCNCWFAPPPITFSYTNRNRKNAMQLEIRLQQVEPLKELSITSYSFDTSGIVRLIQQHPELERFEAFTEHTADIVKSLSFFCTQLTSLSLYCSARYDYKCVHYANFRLRELIVDGEADGLIPDTLVAVFRNLEILHVCSTALGTKKLSLMLRECDRLTELTLDSSSWEPATFQVVGSKKVKHLTLRIVDIGSGLALLFQQLPNLVYAALDYRLIEKNQVRQIVLDHLINLQALYVFSCQRNPIAFPEEWMISTMEMFKSRVYCLRFYSVGRSDLTGAHETVVNKTLYF